MEEDPSVDSSRLTMADDTVTRDSMPQDGAYDIAAAYRFVDIDDGAIDSLRTHLRERLAAGEACGTVLLAREGINFTVAARGEGLRPFLDGLEQDDRFSGLDIKWSQSTEAPFRRLLVKRKAEIIPLGMPSIRPHEKTAPRLGARELANWLDSGRPVTLLDTRNDYEIRLGSFEGAIDCGLETFRSFPEAIERLPAELREQPVVTFCTGGIRCEKAAALLLERGFQEVWQLDGGILRYFEECGARHYDGECFVYDRRVAVDGDLHETSAAVCFHCLEPLTENDQRSPDYIPERSCPYCAGDPQRSESNPGKASH